MKILLRAFCIFISGAIPFALQAQTTNVNSSSKSSTVSSKQAGMFDESTHGSPLKAISHNNTFPSSPLSATISVPGATPIGLIGSWHTQGTRGLHNIQVDPSNPKNIHAVVMTALNVDVANDTVNPSPFFSQRNCYYTFSSDGGATWKTPVALSQFRSGYADMTLVKRSGVYVPVIALHHFTSAVVADLFCSVYIESGSPGDGKFKVGNTDRKSFAGVAHDIIWPAIAVSIGGDSVFVCASVSRTKTADPFDYLQFGWFALASDGTPSVWSGWKKGPAALPTVKDSTGFAGNGEYVMKTSASGKIGIVWHNLNSKRPDLGLYLSESGDDGKTWNAPIKVYSLANAAAISPDTATGYKLLTGGTLDMFYNNEIPNVVFDGFVSQVGGSYYPASGNLLYWHQGMTVPQLLLAKLSNTDLGNPLNVGDFMSTWTTGLGVDPQGANLKRPTIGRTSNSNQWGIFFEVWVQDDNATGYAGSTFDFSTDSTFGFAFHSIYQMTTVDGGVSWSAPRAFRFNDVSLAQEQRIDYRFPEVSSWNPIVSENIIFNTMFAADSMAGEWTFGGGPGFDSVGWYFEKLSSNGVKYSGVISNISLAQNFPNPFVSSTTIPVVMKNDDMVTLSVTDILGREVSVIYRGRLSAGDHRIPFTAPNLGAGIYTYTLRTPEGSVSRTMSVVK